jgi:hypothetical protein
VISVSSSGSTQKTEDFLRRAQKLDVRSILNAAGSRGVAALSAATPRDSGLAASSWDYTVKSTRAGFSIIWTNSDVENGFPVAVMLQYGYATGSGGYVAGRDYINPAMRPVMDQIAADVWRAVTNG